MCDGYAIVNTAPPHPGRSLPLASYTINVGDLCFPLAFPHGRVEGVTRAIRDVARGGRQDSTTAHLVEFLAQWTCPSAPQPRMDHYISRRVKYGTDSVVHITTDPG